MMAAEVPQHLRAGVVDAPELARRLLADHPEAGATAATVVAQRRASPGSRPQ